MRAAQAACDRFLPTYFVCFETVLSRTLRDVLERRTESASTTTRIAGTGSALAEELELEHPQDRELDLALHSGWCGGEVDSWAFTALDTKLAAEAAAAKQAE